LIDDFYSGVKAAAEKVTVKKEAAKKQTGRG
jgi:hypothetical protein